MKNIHPDINDDEIRVISSGSDRKQPDMTDEAKSEVRHVSAWRVVLLVLVILAVVLGAVFFIRPAAADEGPDMLEVSVKELTPEAPVGESDESSSIIQARAPYVEQHDTVVGRQPLSILYPRNAVPRLHLGSDILSDTTAVLVVQAADIRRDNGEIVGAYVYKGELQSRGQSKAGFCAIINGKLTLGVATATPYLENAIESDGYFFRQYPLVVGGQVVENKLRSASLRKALVELKGETAVVMSRNKMTLNDFSQILVDLGVTNAIYLIGSSSNGFAVLEDGRRLSFGRHTNTMGPNTNYIVWE